MSVCPCLRILKDPKYKDQNYIFASLCSNNYSKIFQIVHLKFTCLFAAALDLEKF